MNDIGDNQRKGNGYGSLGSEQQSLSDLCKREHLQSQKKLDRKEETEAYGSLGSAEALGDFFKAIVNH